MFGLGTPTLWVRGPKNGVPGYNLPKLWLVCLGCKRWLGVYSGVRLCSRLGQCSGNELYIGFRTCSGCWTCTGRSRVPLLVNRIIRRKENSNNRIRRRFSREEITTKKKGMQGKDFQMQKKILIWRILLKNFWSESKSARAAAFVCCCCSWTITSA